MAVEVVTPEENMGDVIGDLNSRRGQIQAMDERAGARVVKALVPLSEMFGYVGDLRSKTQGRRRYSMVFDSYAEVPPTWPRRSSRRRRANEQSQSSSVRSECVRRVSARPGNETAAARLYRGRWANDSSHR